jgi:hypothetical protein
MANHIAFPSFAFTISTCAIFGSILCTFQPHVTHLLCGLRATGGWVVGVHGDFPVSFTYFFLSGNELTDAWLRHRISMASYGILERGWDYPTLTSWFSVLARDGLFTCKEPCTVIRISMKQDFMLWAYRGTSHHNIKIEGKWKETFKFYK